MINYYNSPVEIKEMQSAVLKNTLRLRQPSSLLNVRFFSTSCGFVTDFPKLPKTSAYNKAIYNHLRRVYSIDQER